MSPLKSISPLHFIFLFCLLVFPACEQKTPENNTQEAPAEQTLVPGLWRLSDGDTEIFLFGSFHSLPPDLKWQHAHLNQAFEAADTVYFEILLNQQSLQTMSGLVEKASHSKSAPLSKVLTPGQKEKLEKAAHRVNVNKKLLESMEPWLASIMLETKAIARKGYQEDHGVDQLMYHKALRHKKTIQAFETAQQQLGFFMEMPTGTQKNLLMMTINNILEDKGSIEKITDAWVKGDTATLNTHINQALQGTSEDIYIILLKNRNKAWADILEERMKKPGKILVIVGAGHLVGQDNLQYFLKQKGFDVERWSEGQFKKEV